MISKVEGNIIKKDKNLIKETKQKISKDIIKYCMPAVYVFLINLFFIGTNFKFWCPIENIRAMLFECIITYTICICMWSIFGKWKNSVIIFGIFALILSIVNQIKYMFTDEPLVLSDFLFVQDGGEIVDIIQGELWSTIKLCLIPFIIEIILFIICIIIERNLCKNENKLNQKIRFRVIGVSVLFLLILFSPIEFKDKIIKNIVYDFNSRKDYASITSISEYYLQYGIIGGIYGQALESKIVEPEGYDENAIDEELADVKENCQKTLGIPNIIVVFSESFWDIEQLDEIEFNTEVTSNFNKLKDKGLFFNMISPSYGGISANVEYEFLTGSNLMFFNKSYIPYMQLYRNDTYYDRPSIIKELKNNGYRTKIVTYTSKKLFDCEKAYKYMQVDDVEYNVDIDEENKKGQYVSDKYVTDHIIEELNNKNKGDKLFYMTMTMQAHMPYTKEKYDNYDVWVTKSDLSDKQNDVLTSYAQRNL